MTILQEKLARLPNNPGVYRFKDASGQILYVGKALHLNKRVSSYFRKENQQNPRLQLLLGKIHDLDTFLCDSEMEAFLLEYNLIKEHHPPYNIRFRDDKRFPLIKLAQNDPFPYLTISRKRENDKNRYFGPYVSSRAMRETLKILRKIFKIRSCTMKITGHDRPCLYYHINECSAPCISKIGLEEYRKSVEGIVRFLEGKGDALLPELQHRMEEAAKNLDYEQAARFRDQRQAVEEILLRQKVISRRGEDEDYVGIASRNGLCVGEVFHVREGRLIGKEELVFETVEVSLEAALLAFLEKYYQDRAPIPSKIYLSQKIQEIELLENFLSQKSNHPIHLEIPRRGEKKKMLSLLEKNALHSLEMAQLKEVRKKGMMEVLENLQKQFHLPTFPFRIEGYDISTLFGRQSVGSMVVFLGGKPEKSHYRKFFIENAEAPDDFSMMQQLLTRRLLRLEEPEEDPSFSETPDLILLDGGAGQLSIGVNVLKQLRKTEIPLLSLAKKEEEIYSPGLARPVKLSRDRSELKLLQHIRDEAHRFAVTYHKTRRDREVSHSALEAIPGIGEKRSRDLLTSFGSLDQIKVAEPEQISQVLRCSKKTAEQILSSLATL